MEVGSKPKTEVHSLYEAILCLAMNIYHEARDQDLMGQMAVAEVTMNRVKDPRYPDDVCKVVWQNKQFSWTNDGKTDKMYDDKSRRQAMQLAAAYVNGYIQSTLTKGATHYHNLTIKPYWANERKKTLRIGDHIFYKK